MFSSFCIFWFQKVLFYHNILFCGCSGTFHAFHLSALSSCTCFWVTKFVFVLYEAVGSDQLCYSVLLLPIVTNSSTFRSCFEISICFLRLPLVFFSSPFCAFWDHVSPNARIGYAPEPRSAVFSPIPIGHNSLFPPL